MKLKKVITTLTVLSMLVCCASPARTAEVSAKNKTVRKIVLFEGGKQKTWMTLNSKKVSNTKVKWKSSNKKVATVSKKGVIKAKKAGKAKVTAKYKKYTLVVKVTVKKAVTANPSGSTGLSASITPPSANSNTSTLAVTQLAANLAINTQAVPSGYVLFTVTNNNAQMVPSYTINYQLKNTSGVIIKTGSVYGYVIQPGQTQYCSTYLGKSEITTLDVNQSICSVSVSTTNYIDDTANVSVTHQVTSDNDVSLTYFSNSPRNDVDIRSIVLFYDAAGQLIDLDTSSALLNTGETKFSTVSAPYDYDGDYNRISTYSTYNVVYYAYAYN